jgi:phosphoadenosine phosphosulfate reductase
MTHRSLEAPIADLDATAARLEREGARAILAWTFETFGERAAIGTGFGLEGMALVDLAVKLVARPRVFFVDTGFLFPETHDLRRRAEERYGLEIEAIRPALTPEEQEDVYGATLWRYDPDFCCSLRKVEPLEAALEGLDAWITAIRREQTRTRATARAVAWDARRGVVKVSPLVAWSRDDVWAYVRAHEVPYNTLHDRGYPSIGCTHCTRAVAAGEDERAGRWSGHTKTECGLHVTNGGEGDE